MLVRLESMRFYDLEFVRGISIDIYPVSIRFDTRQYCYHGRMPHKYVQSLVCGSILYTFGGSCIEVMRIMSGAMLWKQNQHVQCATFDVQCLVRCVWMLFRLVRESDNRSRIEWPVLGTIVCSMTFEIEWAHSDYQTNLIEPKSESSSSSSSTTSDFECEFESVPHLPRITQFRVYR